MFGLTGVDKGRAGFRHDLCRWIPGLFKDEPVPLPRVFVPAGRAADVKKAVPVINGLFTVTQSPEDACGKG